MGKVLVLVILAAALLTGGAVYWFQVYAYYQKVPATGPSDVVLVPQAGQGAMPLAHAGFQAIDADSSPIRYRACFTTRVTPEELAETARPYPEADPLNGPRWFSCYDAGRIGAALEDGSARAFLSVKNIHYGVDRVIAVTADGHGYAWQQINACGREVFDGKPTPEGCPPPPEGTVRP
ncbi:histidine kinase [Pseudooceanicola sp. CBS1P-1]|uniref:Histidine kinase n=1 Tax=Pseudooceanicola albus TaxID=2692189 RepID=A0A6L7G6S2_9RHOB|nr:MULTISPECIES: DUF6446 family protein [Pseudooceanicola]MBT9385568.1 histidine kinase [Pseudooceanicola endophyticus]MXN19020.1 histidine kinase [Pseudooceanicola albus]